MEDLKPLGLEFIKLGLNDVLYDTKTKEFYTPNTNQHAKMGENPLQNAEKDDTIQNRDYIQDPETGLMMGSTPEGSIDKLGESGIIKLEDIEIGKSLGAKAKNYDVMDLQTGEHFSFVEGTKLQNVEAFAGKGTKTVFRKADKYAERYGGTAEDWQHCKGNGVIDYYGEERKAEVHWAQCEKNWKT